MPAREQRCHPIVLVEEDRQCRRVERDRGQQQRPVGGVPQHAGAEGEEVVGLGVRARHRAGALGGGRRGPAPVERSAGGGEGFLAGGQRQLDAAGAGRRLPAQVEGTLVEIEHLAVAPGHRLRGRRRRPPAAAVAGGRRVAVDDQRQVVDLGLVVAGLADAHPELVGEGARRG